jgi:hypothetical protein
VTAFSPPIGEPCAVQFIAVGRLAVDHVYQRTLQSRRSSSLVESMAHNWDWRLCAPLLVSERQDGLFILDGQHRWAAASMRGDIAFLPCAVGRFGSVADEAMLFVAANRRRVTVSRIDLFRASLAAGHQEEVAVAELMRAAGLAIAPHTNPRQCGPGEIGCTSTLIGAVRRFGEQLVGDALKVIGEAFRGEVLIYAGVLVQGLILLLNNPPADFGRADLIVTLKRRSADDWALHPRVTMSNGGVQRAYALRGVILEQMGLAPVARPGPSPAKTGSSPRTFDEQMEAVRNGAPIANKVPIRRADPERTLGGVGSAML